MADTDVLPPRFSAAFVDDFKELLRWRRDVRRFRPDPLPAGTLEELLDAARLAPSVGFSQPARYVVIDDVQRRAAVIADFERCNAAAARRYGGERAATYAALKLAGLREAPAHLAVFADVSTETGAGLGRQTMPETLSYSVVCAIQTLWLYARARGIGVGWVSIVEPATMAHTLDVPATWQFIAYLCIGYPQEEHTDRELERAHWETANDAASTIVRR